MYICNVESDYNRKNRAKYLLKCHLILCVKYRKKLLVGRFKGAIKCIFESIAELSDFSIETFESDKDHIHFLINYPPKLSISSIVRKLKQESTVFVWRLFERELRKDFWAERTLWSDGYFVCSIGDASPDTIRKYIEQQG